LLGTEVIELRQNVKTGNWSQHVVRAPNGAFQDRTFAELSAVLWIRLLNDGEAVSGTYRGCRNPHATDPLPEEVAQRIKPLLSNDA